ncbi:cytochrome P450 [Nonomuraea sp. NPDC052116]|uniref:cytochrome P450 n=1 Tax=Nonomuraea sp. NPDC052116 TaxID=3155665 RepID=UPI00342C73A2
MRMISSAEQAVVLEEVDLYPAEFYRTGDPHAVWRVLREKAPVWRQQAPDGMEFWSLTRYRDVVAVLGDTGRFSSEYTTMLSELSGDSARGRAIHVTDPPRHTSLRSSTVATMSTKVMRGHESRIRGRIAALVEAALAEGVTDFAALATAVPMAASGAVIGIPEEYWNDVARWTITSMAPGDPVYGGSAPQEALLEAHVSLFAMFGDLIAERRKRPADDLVSALLALRIDGREPTDDDVLVNCYAFIMGANPTVPQVASHLVLAALEDEALWRRLVSEPEIQPTAIEEALRWASPVNHLVRLATEEVRLGDEVIPEGGLVAAWVASANRDEDVFADPYVFDPVRRPNPHIAFGGGPHRCIGNPPARTGLSVLLGELASRVAGFEPAGEVKHLESNFLNGITSLPVVMRPARKSRA